MGRRTNDGNLTGLKQDRYRNSRYEYERDQRDDRFGGMSRKTANTIGGAYEENRGHRTADDMRRDDWDQSPFENGRVHNWNHRKGWDSYYQNFDRGDRNHGGAQLNHDISQRGKGPRGYTRSDDSIYEDVCLTLERSPDVDARGIEVSVKDGCIYLNGNVSSRNAKRMAELEVENISGVKDVQNLLRISSTQEDLH